MKKVFIASVLCLFSIMGFGDELGPPAGITSSLKVLTINVWSGSDYQGSGSFGRWESPQIREQRYQELVTRLRASAPHIIFLQEVNPVDSYSRRLAKDLGMDEVHQVCIAGLKLLGLGIPWGFKEGNAILAKPILRLEKMDDWKLSGGPGIYSDHLSFHADETVSALWARIIWQERPLYLVNVHLSAYPERNEELEVYVDSLRDSAKLSESEYLALKKQWDKGIARRHKETRKLVRRLNSLPSGIPIILGGDFNATPGSPTLTALQKAGFTDTAGEEYYTWDALNNPLTAFSTGQANARGQANSAWESFNAFNAQSSRRVDYLMVNQAFKPEDIQSNSAVLTDPPVSDHYGVETRLALWNVMATTPRLYDRIPADSIRSFSLAPILMYDTDTGFGYGGKFLVENLFKLNESVDLIVFNSSKGERWYKLVYSQPDRERRQGRKYGLAFDLTIDYDRWNKAWWFGTGPQSGYEGRENYRKELFDVYASLARPYGRYLTASLGARFKRVAFGRFPKNGALWQYLYPGDPSDWEDDPGYERVDYFSNTLGLSYDNRDSVFNPSRGFYGYMSVESNLIHYIGASFSGFPGLKSGSGSTLEGKFSYTLSDPLLVRNTLSAQYYQVLWYPRTVLALRVMAQSQIDMGEDFPPHALLSLGGGTTLRGSPMDRYLDNNLLVGNAELRFPIYGVLGGIIGYDIGQVSRTPALLKLNRWASNPVVGLRLYIWDFIARADLGFGKDSTGFYFNFGHAF